MFYTKRVAFVAECKLTPQKQTTESYRFRSLGFYTDKSRQQESVKIPSVSLILICFL